MKEKTSFTLSHEARELLRKISEKMGISQASVLELLIREKARAIEKESDLDRPNR